ncbi:MAG: hypothetical protein ACRDD1_08020, partial [Planctomycetia bacterium]
EQRGSAPSFNPSRTPSAKRVERLVQGSNGIRIGTLLGSRNGRAVGRGVALTQLQNRGGRWQTRLTGGRWRTVRSGSLSTRRALLLREGDGLRFVGSGGRVNMQYLAWNQGLGRAGGFANAVRRGGQTPFSRRGQAFNFGDVGRGRSAAAANSAATESTSRKAAALSALAVDAFLAATDLDD